MISGRSRFSVRALPRGLLLLASIASIAGCASGVPVELPAGSLPTPVEPIEAPVAATVASAPPGGPSPTLPPTATAGATLIDLPVEGHRDAVVSVPPAATSPRPLLVVAHGAGGRPEPHCAFWREIVGARGFVLCPRGVLLGVYAAPADQGYFYPDHHALEREVVAALAALRARFGAELDDRAPIYAGFSQGATMGALAFVKRPAAFARLVLIEGGVGESDEWTINGARAFREGGAERVLFACGRPTCFTAAQRSLTYLGKAGLEGRVVHAVGAGHTYGGAVADVVTRALPWVFEGDPRWSGG
jgi:pimeloyl-ACP methyl ester carboxylesterase